MPPAEDQVYRLLVESISDYGVYLLDPTGIVTSWNPGAERFMGYQAPDVMGQHFSRFYTAADQAAGVPAAALETAAHTGKFEGEGWRVRKDGQQFWSHVVIDPIRDADGNLVGFAKITRDISEPRRFEANLARSEEQFKLLVQGVTDYALYLLDPEGRVSSWNTGAQRIKGYPAEEIVGEHFARFYTPEDRAAGEPQNTLDTAEREGRFETQGWRVRRDGSRFWASVVVDAIRGHNGALTGFAKITRDLSDIEQSSELIVQANRSLLRLNEVTAKSEARFRQMVEAAPNAIVLADAAGRIRMVNAQTEQLFGYQRPELLASTVETLLTASERGQHPALRARFFAAPTARPMAAGRAVFGVKHDGTEVPLEVRLSPIETDEGIMVLSAVVDISDRVRLEEQLRQSQKMDAIGRVTAGVAHDFNNLLQALGGSLEMMVDGGGDRAAVAEWGKIALRATTRGKELTHRLLSFARNQVLIARPLMIDVLFRELKELIAHLFEANINGSIELEMLPGRPGLGVLADVTELEAALINLAVNARDVMGPGGRLRISAREADADPAIVPPGRYTVITVADNGVGMDAATLAQACEPFFTTKGPEGTGLGLPMVQGFARQSGGNVCITSVVGEGTTVALWLPSASVPAVAEAPVAAPAPADGHILVVDDSTDSLLVVSAFLRRAGLDVTGQTSGQLALAELASGKRFDALVTDFAMPGMNGLELLTQARQIDPAMPAMIMTGFSDRKAMAGFGHVAVLHKPFSRLELTEAVQRLVAAKRAAGGT